MKNSFMAMLWLGFFALPALHMPPVYAAGDGKPGVQYSEAEVVQALNAANEPRKDIPWRWNRDWPPAYAYAYVNYLLRVASKEVPGSGGEGMRGLGYDGTNAILNLLMKQPASVERDRALIIFWSFFANASINFYNNRHESHSERWEAIARLGIEGMKLSIRSLLAGHWVYTGFGVTHPRNSFYTEALIEAKKAGLLKDPEIRDLFEKYLEQALDFVTSAQAQEKKSYETARMWLQLQNPKSAPPGLVIQIRTFLSLGLPKNPLLLGKMKAALREPLFLENNLKNVESYRKSQANESVIARENALLLLDALEKPGNLQALQNLLEGQKVGQREFRSYGKSVQEFLFDIEVKFPGTVQALIAKVADPKNLQNALFEARLYDQPDVDVLTPEVLRAFKTMYRLDLVTNSVALSFALKHDLLVHDRSFTLPLLDAEVLRPYSMESTLVLNKGILGILNSNLTKTEATFLAAVLNQPKVISKAVESLRFSAADMSFNSRSNSGEDFRSIMHNMTIATLFASSKVLNGNYLATQMPEAKTIQNLLGDLYDGSRQRGARFDHAADTTKDRLFIAVVKALRSGVTDPTEVWEKDVKEIKGRTERNHTFEFNVENWAGPAVDYVTARLKPENLPALRKGFAQLVDLKALEEAAPRAVVSVRSCRAVLALKK